MQQRSVHLPWVANTDGELRTNIFMRLPWQMTRNAGTQTRTHDISNRMNTSRRIGALRRRMAKQVLPSLLVTHPADIRYLCGFTGSSAALAVTRRAVRLFTDGRYAEQAAAEVKAAQVEIVSGAAVVAAVQWLAAQ